MSRSFAATKNRATGRGADAASAEETNVLGRTVRVRGRVLGDGDLRVEGDVEGDVRVRGSLEIAEGGVVTGNVAAHDVILSGTLTGDVEADGSVLIRAGSRIAGNMNGAEVALEEGAEFSGRIEAAFELPDGLGSSLGGAGDGARGRSAGRRK